MNFSRRVLLTLSSNIVARKFCMTNCNRIHDTNTKSHRLQMQKSIWKVMFSLNSKQFRFRFLVTMLRHWAAVNSDSWRLLRTSIILEQEQSQMLLERKLLKVDLNQSLSWNCSRCNSKWIYESNSILTLLVQNLFIINRFKHLEPKESIDSIIYSQYRIFDVFVRVHRNENTAPHKMRLKQWARIGSALSEIKACAEISTRKFASLESWIWRVMDLTDIQHAQQACNRSERAYYLSSRPVMSHGHTIVSQPSKKSPLNSIYSAYR